MRQSTHARAAALIVLLLVCAGAVAGQQNANSTNQGLERTPAHSWNSWSFLKRDPTAAKIEAQARALRDSGLQKIGYNYVNIDDFWYQCPVPRVLTSTPTAAE